MAAVKQAPGRKRSRGLTTKGARVRQLLDRLERETDPKARAVIEAQLAYFGRDA